MANTLLRAPQWSFVHLTDFNPLYGCLPNPDFCLPIKEMRQVKFQMYAETLSTPPVVAFPIRTVFAYPVPADLDCDVDPQTIIPDLFVRAIVARQENISDKPDTEAVFFFDDMFINDFDDAPTNAGTIAVGDCLKFMLVEMWTSDLNPEVIISATVIGCTNCFKRIDAECWLTELTYRGADNQFDFYYVEAGDDMLFENKILLPFYLKNPQLASEQTSYRKSDGSYIKLSERIEEVVDIETDWWPHLWHRQFKIALAHDTVEVFNANYSDLAPVIGGTIVCEAPYQIDWVDNYTRAKASTTVKISAPLSLYNSNCITA